MVAIKFLFLFFLVGMAMASKEVPTIEGMLEDRKFCTKVYPVSEQEIDDIHANKCPENADRLLKCYVRCYLTRIGAMNSEGVFNPPMINDIVNVLYKKTLKKDPFDTIKECTKKRPEHGLCDRAYAAVKCVGDRKLW